MTTIKVANVSHLVDDDSRTREVTTRHYARLILRTIHPTVAPRTADVDTIAAILRTFAREV